MQSEKQKFPVTFFILITLILIGNIGFRYIIGLFVGSAEFQIISLVVSLILILGCSFLRLKIIYHIHMIRRLLFC